MAVKTTLQEELLAAAPGRVRFNEPMRLHSTFHIGGPAEVWAEPQQEEELQRLFGIARQADLSVTVVGGGANLLVRDEGIPGLVVRLAGPGFQDFSVRSESFDLAAHPEPVEGRAASSGQARRRASIEVHAGAALPLEWLIRRAQEAGLSGVEFLAGVPGRVGGAVRMNAGTHDDEGETHSLGDILQSVRVMERSGQVRSIEAEKLHFRYRGCDLDGEIVLSAVLRLASEDREAIARRVERLWEYKKRTQDWTAPSVGCIFKNPPGASAGRMIDQTGLKGYPMGGAAFSTKHANFIMNRENASASDVSALIQEARARVLRQFGVELELEVKVLP